MRRYEFAGGVAVVTGAASGIGLGLSERFAAEGMHVVMADVEEPALSKAASALADNGASVLPVLTDPQRLWDMSRAAAEFGRRDADDLLVGMVYEAIASRHR